MPPSDRDIADSILALTTARGAGKSICPSEVARDLAAEWRDLMPRVRAVAAGLAGIKATQKGATVDPVTAKGPIRLTLK